MEEFWEERNGGCYANSAKDEDTIINWRGQRIKKVL